MMFEGDEVSGRCSFVVVCVNKGRKSGSAATR